MALVSEITRQCEVDEHEEQDFTKTLQELEAGSRSAVKISPNFDPSSDANALYKAVMTDNVDEATIINILTRRNNFQRQKIKAVYLQQTGESLSKALKKALNGNFEQAVLALLKTPARFDADELRAALKGLGYNEFIMNEILTTRNNAEIREINRVYKEELNRDLMKDIIKGTSGDYQKALLSLAKGDRSEDEVIDKHLARSDAKALYEAGEGKRKEVDVDVFINVLTTRSMPHLDEVYAQYRFFSTRDLLKAMDQLFKGEIRDLFKDIVVCASEKALLFAHILFEAMERKRTDSQTLTRVMVSRSEIDLKEIKVQFQKLNTSKSLTQMIQKKTNGDYQKIMLALCEANPTFLW